MDLYVADAWVGRDWKRFCGERGTAESHSREGDRRKDGRIGHVVQAEPRSEEDGNSEGCFRIGNGGKDKG